MERTDIRKVEALPERVDVATIDVSFISLGLVLPAARSLVDPSAEVLCLVKPQFEVGRGQVGRGGVVRDANLHRAVLDKVCGYLTAHGWSVLNAVMSPVPGASGNREFWLLARPEAQRADAIGLDEVLRRTGLPQGG
jgi:23S rRNA (cytidine1920-2'-O)/16S rRNA (cytidine1409-2'-O)-methyltransferase